MTPYLRYCEIRDLRGFKDANVAFGTGINKSVFSEWKNGKSQPKADKLKKIADFLDTTIDYILTGDTLTAEGTYTNPETEKLAREIYENPDLRLLVNATKDATPEDLRKLVEIAKVMRGESK